MIHIEPGPRGACLLVESQHDLPMVWIQIAIVGGAAGDPPGVDGFHHHLIQLARRGAGPRARLALDTALDVLGATVECWAHRDAMILAGLCLRRNLDRLCALIADILAEPTLARDEHEKLIRESRRRLDDVRDEDDQLAVRYFQRDCVPGHPYGRTLRGTEASLSAIDLADIEAAHRRVVVPENLIIGFAGAIDEDDAARYGARLVERLPDAPAPPLPPVSDVPPRPRGRRLLIVDKPERQQAQLAIGHLAPRYGSDETPAVILLETVFGGMFTSRLMQEIRVKRGWSYGADCHWYRSRGPHWFSIHLAPPVEVTADALALTLRMFEELARDGLSAEELAFGQRFLAGNLAFQQATARRRLDQAIRERISSLERGFSSALIEQMAAVTLDEVNRTAETCLHPGDVLCVVVATADDVLPSLQYVQSAATCVVPYDFY